MSRLNRLIDEELERNKPSDSVVLRSSDGVEIPEDNINIEIMNIKPTNTNMLVEVDEAYNTLQTITNLTDLLRKMRSEGENKENMVVIAKAINDLSGVKVNEFSMECYDGEYSLVDYTISTEGIWDVIKTIFRKIRDIIVGFFKAIWNTIKSLFGYKEVVDKVNDSNKKRLKNIIDKGLKLDPADAKPINTYLGILSCTPNEQETDYKVHVRYAVMMYDKFVDVINNGSISTLDFINNDILPEVGAMIDLIKDEEITKGTLDRLDTHCTGLLGAVAKLRTLYLKHETAIASVPGPVLSKVTGVDVNKSSTKVSTLVDTSDSDKKLSRDYNAYAFINSSMLKYNNLSKLTQEEVTFAFLSETNVIGSNEAYKVYVDPIMDPQDLVRLQEKRDSANKAIDFSKLNASIKRVSDSITRTTDYLAEKGYVYLEDMKKTIETGLPTRDRLKTILNNLCVSYQDKHSELDVFKSKTRNKAEYIKNKTYLYITNNKEFEAKYVILERPIDDSVIDMIYTSSGPEDVNEFINLAGRMGYLDDSVTVSSRALTEDEKEHYRDLDKKFNYILRYGLNSFSKLVSIVGADIEKLYIDFDKEVVNYIQKSEEQYR